MTQQKTDPWSDVLIAWVCGLGAMGVAWAALPENLAPYGSACAWTVIAVGAMVRRGPNFPTYGLTCANALKALGLTCIYACVFLPPFVVALMVLWPDSAGQSPSVGTVLSTFGHHLVVAAIPEELFFRGFVQGRLTTLYGKDTKNVLGLRLNLPVFATALLFGITHLSAVASLWSLQALERLSTFFPGLLFGSLREHSKGLLAPILFHAICNTVRLTLFN